MEWLYVFLNRMWQMILFNAGVSHLDEAREYYSALTELFFGTSQVTEIKHIFS